LHEHASPLSWEPIDFTGIYFWGDEQQSASDLLRLPGRILRVARWHPLFGHSVRFRAVLVPTPEGEGNTAVGGRAGLARIADRAIDGCVDIRVIEDDEGSVAAEREADPL